MIKEENIHKVKGRVKLLENERKMLSVNDSIDFSVSMTIFHLIIMRTV